VGRLILLVEDDRDDAELTRLALRAADSSAEIHTVPDGQEALDFLFARGAHAGRDPAQLPAVVVLDLDLPKVSGPEVLQELRADERTRTLPVVVLTGSQRECDALSSYKDGANSFLRKPIAAEEFARAVRELGMYWALLNDPAAREKDPSAGAQ
jgi:CheY-like chemotaxis protein